MTRPTVVVLDYGFGNIRSAQRALERVGADVTVSADADLARRADGLVVPGVGAFVACAAGLRAVAGDDVVRDRIAAGAPVLGICVGMQVMYERGTELGQSADGIGVLAGEVRALVAPVLPHMGWNTVKVAGGSQLFAGVEDARFYFVHSYAACSADDADNATWAEHGEPFVAAVEHGVLTATQFHPEKSGDAGAHLLTNWLETVR